MGTIFGRRRKDGSVGYTVQIVRKKAGKRIYSQAETFERKSAAMAWMRKREAELDAPGGLEKALRPESTVTLKQALERLLADSRAPMGRTKRAVLERLKTYELADLACGAIRPEDIVALAQQILSRGVKPATVGRELAHLQGIFKIAKPAWGYPLEPVVIREAMVAIRMLGLAGEGRGRERRPTLEELDRLMDFFMRRSLRDPICAPMHKIIAFAIFSTRRQDEICRIVAGDLDPGGPRVLVRDMKHPGQKVGNDVWVDLPEPCLGIIGAISRRGAGRAHERGRELAAGGLSAAGLGAGLGAAGASGAGPGGAGLDAGDSVAGRLGVSGLDADAGLATSGWGSPGAWAWDLAPEERLFPYTAPAISAAFTRACALLEIKDLRFHDLRHEGISRLFEMGWSIPQVAAVSGHRSWDSLRRYTQLRQTGDKFEGWKWLGLVTSPWTQGLAAAA
jgi:integrase